MRKRLKRIITSGCLLVFLFLVTSLTALAQQDTGRIRFVHVVPGVAPIDVYINGTLSVSNLPYASATTYLAAPVGNHAVTVTLAGVSDPLWSQDITVTADLGTTFFASSPDAPQFDSFFENLTPLATGTGRLRIVHALAGGPAVDVALAESVELGGQTQAAGLVVASQVAYATSFGDFDLPVGTYVFDVLAGANILLPALRVPLATSTSHVAMVHGTADSPQLLVLTTPTNADAGSGFVRVAHGATAAPSVSVYLNDTLVIPELAPRAATEHIPVAAGEYTLSVRTASTDEELISGPFIVNADEAQTVIALPDEAGGVTANSFTDEIGGISESQALVSVINAVNNSQVSVTLEDGTPIVENVAFGEASVAQAIAPTQGTLGLNLSIGDQIGELPGPETTLYGGVYYNVFAVEGETFQPPMLVITSTSLVQSVASAPGSDVSLAVTQPTADPAPTQAADVTTVAPTEALVVPAPPTATVAAPVSDVVTGRVIIDPSRNLQLRNLPNENALSLGLAPSGSILTINGREGRPVALAEGAAPPPEAATFVDPAAELSDLEDILPELTWLYVTYETPDGGAIDAWVRADFLDVRDGAGELQRLASLPTVPGNQPGSAAGTELTPPPAQEDRVSAVVFNLNPGVSLNIRRTPSVTGEVLERIPLGTVLNFEGLLAPTDATALFIPSEVEWVFIEYAPPEGGTITGWVSTLYVQYEFNGEIIDVEELQERDLLELIPADRVGQVRGGAEQAPLPTVDPLRDSYVAEVQLPATTNLQFRISPDETSESLNLIPPGTQLIIQTRTPDGLWLRTTFEGEVGWINSQFVRLTFNDELVIVSDIPVDPTTITTPNVPQATAAPGS